MAIKAIINNTEKEIEQIKNSNEQDIDYVYSRIGDTEVEGEPPISIKSIGENLANYRIYGNTVDGESVGDRTANLWDETIIQGGSNNTGTIIDGNPKRLRSDYIFVEPGETYSFASNLKIRLIYSYDDNNQKVSLIRDAPNGDISYTFTVPNAATKIIITVMKRINNVEYDITPDDFEWGQLEKGSVVTSYEPYGYRVPVTVEGKNLAKNNHADSSALFAVEEVNNFIHVSGTNNSGSTKAYVISKENTFPAGSYDIVNNSDTTIGYDYKDNNDALVYGTVSANSIKTFNFPAVFTRYLNIYKSVLNGDSIDNYFQVMIVKHGDDTDTYEPYHAPITTPVYLPEPIKIVGDEAEYVDYGAQKMHRVRKNLLQNTVISQTINGVTFTVNSDGSVVCDGQASLSNADLVNPNFLLPSGTYILTGCPNGGSERETYKILLYINGTWRANDKGSGANFTLTETSTVSVRIVIYAGYTCDNVIFYPMIRKADIEDNTYEPYIENTDLDVTLPALSTIKGTNTLSVNTTIQPSNIYIKDNFDYKRIFTATRAIEDGLPLNYKNIEDNDSALSNYRIYGDTVGGESVGDRTGNLFDFGEWSKNINANDDNSLAKGIDSITITANSNDAFTTPYAYVHEGVYKIYVKPNTNYLLSWVSNNNLFGRVFIFKNGISDGTHAVSTNNNTTKYLLFGTDADTEFITLRFGVGTAGNTITYSKIMLNEGSTALPYEPYGYRVPVTVTNGTDTQTTNLYLPEQIKMVDDEAEYIDYVEQKQHRVRKNLFDEKYENIPENLPIYEPIYVGDGYFTLSTTAPLNANSAANMFLMSGDVQIGASTATTGVWSGHKGTVESVNGYITVAYRYQYGVDPRNYNTMLNSGSEPLAYEPYIENTDLDVTLPALPTLSGTNTLSVGTEVQPSKVYVKGKIKEIN